jgi:hypothetical protein
MNFELLRHKLVTMRPSRQVRQTLSFPTHFRPVKPTQNHHGKPTGLAGDAVVTIALEWTRKKRRAFSGSGRHGRPAAVQCQ